VGAEKRDQALECEEKQKEEERFREENDGVDGGEGLEGEDPGGDEGNALTGEEGAGDAVDENDRRGGEQDLREGDGERTGTTEEGEKEGIAGGAGDLWHAAGGELAVEEEIAAGAEVAAGVGLDEGVETATPKGRGHEQQAQESRREDWRGEEAKTPAIRLLV
jgi:hypothetical protein